MIKERLLAFIEKLTSDIEKPGVRMLNSNKSKCIIFKRAYDFDEMEGEEDEKYDFFTSDYKISARFDRFQTKIILSQFGPRFSPEIVDVIIKMAWNFPKVLINQATGEFEPFNDNKSSLPPLPASGGPPVRTVYIDR